MSDLSKTLWEHSHARIDRRSFLGWTASSAAGVAAGLPLFSRTAAQEGTAAATGKALSVLSADPLNAEPDLAQLAQSWITPLKHFYVRNHGTVPQVDVNSFQFSVEGLVHKPLKLSVRQLQDRLPKTGTVATMTCAGNRRTEHSRTRQVDGVPWGPGATGNARWDGARLSDLLELAEIKSGAKHVWFEGVDRFAHGAETISFGGSIPLEKALADSEETPGTLLAYEMNDLPLKPEHGYPLRTVVPGFIGARSVKWLGKIVVSDRPSPNHYVSHAYKLVTEGTDDEWAAARPIYEFPLNSVIASPAAGAVLKAGRVVVRGYALAPGVANQRLARVELSADQGRSWMAARFTTPAHRFCWRLWEAEFTLPPGAATIIARAVDSSGAAQPEKVPWNLKGYLYNGWHRVGVRVEA